MQKLDSHELESLMADLGRAGERLSRAPQSTARELRSLKSAIAEARRGALAAADVSFQLVASLYCLDRLFDEILDNLIGDAPWSDSWGPRFGELRDALVRRIGEYLIKVGHSLLEDELDKSYELCGMLVKEYVEAIADMTKIMAGDSTLD